MTLHSVLASVRSVFIGKSLPLDGSVYDVEVVDNSGQKVSLGEYRGKKLLIVNTASKCGYTPQLQQLQILHNSYHHKVEVLAFPSNDFWQEQGSDADIASFCLKNYGVTFPIFKKINVIGRKMHPLYRMLLAKSGRAPQWNFCKYLLDENGNFMEFFTSKVKPLDKQITSKL